MGCVKFTKLFSYCKLILKFSDPDRDPAPVCYFGLPLQLSIPPSMPLPPQINSVVIPLPNIS